MRSISDFFKSAASFSFCASLASYWKPLFSTFGAAFPAWFFAYSTEFFSPWNFSAMIGIVSPLLDTTSTPFSDTITSSSFAPACAPSVFTPTAVSGFAANFCSAGTFGKVFAVTVICAPTLGCAFVTFACCGVTTPASVVAFGASAVVVCTCSIFGVSTFGVSAFGASAAFGVSVAFGASVIALSAAFIVLSPIARCSSFCKSAISYFAEFFCQLLTFGSSNLACNSPIRAVNFSALCCARSITSAICPGTSPPPSPPCATSSFNAPVPSKA